MLGRLCPSSSTARASSTFLQVGSIFQLQSADVHHHKEREDLPRYLGIHRSNKARANRNTHVNEKLFRRLRGKKTVLVDLPDDAEERKLDSLPPQQLRIELLKKGINPYREVSPRVWQEGQVTMSSFYAVMDPYVAPGGITSLKGLDEIKDWGKHKWHNWRNGTNRIRKKEGMQKFDPKTFGPTAEDVYVQAYKALMERNKNTIHKFITELAYAKMWPDVESGSIKWELIEWLEPSQVVSIRCADYPPQSGNDIAQLTVRMHSRQKIAVFDRFGHLILGSETEPKDVIEYVVFENHIALIDGSWRLHEKVHPKWSQPKEGTHITHEISDSSEENRPSTTTNLPFKAEDLEKERKKEKTQD